MTPGQRLDHGINEQTFAKAGAVLTAKYGATEMAAVVTAAFAGVEQAVRGRRQRHQHRSGDQRGHPRGAIAGGVVKSRPPDSTAVGQSKAGTAAGRS